MTKYTAIIQTLSTFGKAHKNAINGVLQRTINTRVTEKVHLTNFRATNEEHASAPPQKISKVGTGTSPKRSPIGRRFGKFAGALRAFCGERKRFLRET